MMKTTYLVINLSRTNTGGAHGGSTFGGGAACGSFKEPMLQGAGGKNATSGGSGGAAIQISAASFVLNGSIAVDGGSGLNGGPGGAGGSVLVNVSGELFGGGSISSSGSNFAMWSSSGACVVNGMCVSSSNYGLSNYGTNEVCQIKPMLSPTSIYFVAFSVAAVSSLTVNTIPYTGSTLPPNVSITSSISWRSGAATSTGWMFCASPQSSSGMGLAGSGGRIAVYSSNDVSQSLVAFANGGYGAQPGSAGTVYFAKVAIIHREPSL